MTLEESREVIPMMETMINQIEEQQNLMAEMVQELQERDRQLLSFQEQNQSLKSLNSELSRLLNLLPDTGKRRNPLCGLYSKSLPLPLCWC